MRNRAGQHKAAVKMLLKLRRPDNLDRNNPGSRADFDVIGPDGKKIGRIMKPGGGAEHWFWAFGVTARPPLRGSGTAPTREQAQADFRTAWERWLAARC